MRGLRPLKGAMGRGGGEQSSVLRRGRGHGSLCRGFEEKEDPLSSSE